MSATSSYKIYRDSLKEEDAPCIPYIGTLKCLFEFLLINVVGVHLTDLTAMHESQKNTLAPKYPEYLNFTKHANVAGLIKYVTPRHIFFLQKQTKVKKTNKEKE